MRTCINGATTMPYGLVQDISAASKAGFEGVEIWASKLDKYLEGHTVGELKTLIDDNGLKIGALCPYGLVAFSDYRERIAAIGRAAEVAAGIGCDVLLVCPDAPPAEMDRGEAFGRMAEIARQYADAASARGVRVAIEPLGRHPFVPGPDEALEIIRRADHPALGLMMDTFHYYKSGVPLEAVRALPVERLLIVHVNDCEDRPREQLTDRHRLYPGEGIIPLRDMLGAIRDNGYRGFLSVEVFREEYWRESPEAISLASKRTLDGVIASLS